MTTHRGTIAASMRGVPGYLDPGAGPEGDGVLFRMGAGGDDGYREWITRRLDPHALVDRGWIPVSVDLSRYGGKRVSLILNTNTGLPDLGDDRSDLAYWVAPRIRTY